MKKKIIKLLDAGAIYPILYSAWVSSFQWIINKKGIIVLPNENNDLYP